MRRRPFLIVTAVVESATGLALLALPRVPLALLFGLGQPGPEAILLSRFAGAALLAIGAACWLARTDSDSPSQRGLLVGVLIYDVAAAALLAYAGSVLSMAGIALWPAVAIHAALALWCWLCARRAPSDRLPQEVAGGTHR